MKPKIDKRPRRVVVIEYDVSRMSQAEIDALLVCALRRAEDVSFKIEIKP